MRPSNAASAETSSCALNRPDDSGRAQAIGRTLRAEVALGIVYPSVRQPGGQCLAALRTALVKNCLHAAYLEYQWNGEGIDGVFEVNRVM